MNFAYEMQLKHNEVKGINALTPQACLISITSEWK